MNEEFDIGDMWRCYIDLTPKKFAECLRIKGDIVGQDNAIKTASLILYNHIRKRRSVNLYIGPSGCGKSHVWNVLQTEMGAERILIYDASMLTAEGYKGSTKISTIFKDIPPECRSRIILVLDEFDKLLEPQYSSHGTNYSDMVQNQLLRLFNGDILVFAGEDGFSADSSGISIVLLGAFQNLTDKKKRNSASIGTIGFERQSHIDNTNGNSEITIEDLIDFGMRRELAGRITRITCMSPLSVEDLTNIGQKEVKKLEQQLQRKIMADYSVILDLAYKAAKKGLGARWLKSQLNNSIDSLLYDNPNADSFTIDFNTLDADESSQTAFME